VVSVGVEGAVGETDGHERKVKGSDSSTWRIVRSSREGRMMGVMTS
jgi:hypothetical protein